MIAIIFRFIQLFWQITISTALFFYLTASSCLALSNDVDENDNINIHSLPFIQKQLERELVLQLHMGRYILSEGFIGFAAEGGALLPLSEIAYILEFPIDVNPSQGKAKGWFLQQKKTFSLDYAHSEILIEGEKRPFNINQIELHEDDIYIHSSLLAKWFPIRFVVDYTRMIVKLKTQETLPFQARITRENNRLSLAGNTQSQTNHYPRQKLPYRFIDWPYADFSMNYNFNRNANEENQQSVTQEWTYSSHLAADLLWMSGSLFFSGDDEEGISDASLRLTRKDPDGKILWGGITEINIGDIYTPDLNLISSSSSARGLMFSSFDINRSSQFSATDLRGELPIGWELELYRNGSLIDSQAASSDARYEFLNVALLYGSNVLTLKFYGPQGQKREETKVIKVGASQLKPGDFQFRISAFQPNQDLFSFVDSESTNDSINNQLSLETEYGLSNNLTLAARITNLPWEEEERLYSSIGLRSSFLGISSEFDVAIGQDTGSATQLQLQTSLLSFNINASHTQYDDFENNNIDKNYLSSSDLRLDTSIPESTLPEMPISLSGTLDRFTSDNKQLTLENSLSLYFSTLSLTNKLYWSKYWRADQNTTKIFSGSFLTSMPWRDFRFRAGLNYQLDPDSELQSAYLSTNWSIENSYNLNFDISHSLINDQTDYNIAISRQFERMNLGLNSAYNSDGDIFIGSSLSFAIGREPRSASWYMKSNNIANNGGVSARIFMDENLNGRYDQGEPPLKGVRLAYGSRNMQASDKDGILFLPTYSSYNLTDITLDISSLEDPYLMSTNSGISSMLRPGRTLLTDFPVSYTGEIDGSVYLDEGKHSKALSNVILQLVDTNGTTVAETKTAFDGFYLFSNVLPGRYQVRPSLEQAKRLKLKVTQNKNAIITKEGEVLSNINFDLQRYKSLIDNPNNNNTDQQLAKNKVKNRDRIDYQRAKIISKPRELPSDIHRQLNGKSWYMKKNDATYTLQLIGLSDYEHLLAFARKSQLPWDSLAYHLYQKNNKKLFMLTYGTFSSYKASLLMLDKLPNTLKKIKPWARSIGPIKAQWKS